MSIIKEKVAAYIRVSTDSSDQDNSYEIQERHFNQLLSGNSGWMSAGIYSDYGLSGTNESDFGGYFDIARRDALIGLCVNPFPDLPEIRPILYRL